MKVTIPFIVLLVISLALPKTLHAQEQPPHPSDSDIGTPLLIGFVTIPAILSTTTNYLIHDRYTRNLRGNFGMASGVLAEATGLGLSLLGSHTNRVAGLVVLGIGAHTYKMGQRAFREDRKPHNRLTISPTLQKTNGKDNLGVAASFSVAL
jgi:hypothetical protein